jgi:hypothetical protein
MRISTPENANAAFTGDSGEQSGVHYAISPGTSVYDLSRVVRQKTAGPALQPPLAVNDTIFSVLLVNFD